MIVLGNPHELVSITERKDEARHRRPLFRFDKDGMYETDDAKILKRLKSQFHIFDNIESANESKKVKRHCSKCDFTCTNQGDMLTHHRKAHPKKT